MLSCLLCSDQQINNLVDYYYPLKFNELHNKIIHLTASVQTAKSQPLRITDRQLLGGIDLDLMPSGMKRLQVSTAWLMRSRHRSISPTPE